MISKSVAKMTAYRAYLETGKTHVVIRRFNNPGYYHNEPDYIYQVVTFEEWLISCKTAGHPINTYYVAPE